MFNFEYDWDNVMFLTNHHMGFVWSPEIYWGDYRYIYIFGYQYGGWNIIYHIVYSLGESTGWCWDGFYLKHLVKMDIYLMLPKAISAQIKNAWVNIIGWFCLDIK